MEKKNCLICGAELEYLEEEEEMECALCRAKEKSRARCADGHYVCDECHTSGMDAIFDVCMSSASKNPIEIIDKIMSLDFCHMHGPEHHVMVGSALLAAYRNAGGNIDLQKALNEMRSRGKKVPGGVCGFWGACGAGISSGMFVSIATGSMPLKNRERGLANKMTSRSLYAIGEIGGPRCCKRDSFLSIIEAVKFAKENLGVEMETGRVECRYSQMNKDCIKERCPFRKA